MKNVVINVLCLNQLPQSFFMFNALEMDTKRVGKAIVESAGKK